MNIFIASDHAGFELKTFLIESLSHIKHTVIDCGTYAYNESDDYPPFIAKAAKAVSDAEMVKIAQEEESTLAAGQHGEHNQTVAIVIGGSGTGEAIVSNKFPHVRCALCYGGEHAVDIIRLSREHNNSNVLSLGARFLAHDQALELVLEWLNTSFSGDSRHIRRLHEVEVLEQHKNQSLYE